LYFGIFFRNLYQMSKLAKYLIEKEKNQKTKFLDLGNCGLKDLSIEIPELFELEWLETLILSNGYVDLRTQEKRESINAETQNEIVKLPYKLKSLTNLKALYLSSFEIIQKEEDLWEIEPIIMHLSGLEVIQNFKDLEILDCRYREVSSLEFLNDLQKLQHINLSNNQIEDLQFLDESLSLQSLILEENQISEIKGIYNLPKLQHLNLNLNQLTNVSGLATFDTLKTLNLQNNKIFELKGIQNLTALENLNLSSNGLSQIFRLGKLTALENLDIENNDVQDADSLRNLTNLKYLNLSETGPSDIDWLVSLSNLEVLKLKGKNIENALPITTLINLVELDLAHNTISSLDGFENLTALAKLNLSANQITDISPLIGHLKKADWAGMPYAGDVSHMVESQYSSYITFGENPIENPPYEIAQGNNETSSAEEILNFFANTDTAEIATDDFYEAKILIIGEGGAGKTTLFRKLRHANSKMPAENESTMGIDIHQLNLRTRNGKDIRANIWDFGGQEIYHSTHQFFFSKRALYILVDDTRINNDTTVNDKSFAYWFGLVDLLGGESPLLIVQNEKNDRSKQLETSSMRGRFDFVKETLQTNLMTGRGLPEVHQAIEDQVQNLLRGNVSLPISWVDIRKEIDTLTKETHEISASRWREICKNHGIENVKQQKSLSQYFHDVGVFLHFQEDALLRKSVFLQKNWVTAAIYRILDDETIKAHGGQFEEADLKRLWKEGNLAEYHNEFLALMIKFELCFELPDRSEKKWLAPQLMSNKQPKYNWISENNKELHFKYDFLPSGMISRLIVRLHRFVVRTDLAWRNGIVLERLGAQAEIMEIHDDTIRIRVVGEDQTFRKELLTIITDEFDQMHKKFTGLKLDKWVACNCQSCDKSEDPQLFDYNALLQRKKNGKTEKECDKSYEIVSVNDLLGEASSPTPKKKKLDKKGKLRSLLADNRKAEVFIELKKLLPDETLITQVESRWKKLRKNEIAGILSYENTTIERNKITYNLLEMVNGIEE
jgi:internalin A